MIRKGFIVFITFFCLLALSHPVFAEQPKKSEDPGHGFRLWIGYNWYKMEDFNNKLYSEGNKTIDGGVNLGIETNVVDLPLSLLISQLPGSIKLPLGIEYLSASSKTTHTAAGGSATVNWELPVVGVYIAPSISFSEKTKWFYLRPIGVGYYTLGKLTDAKLTVSDRPGSLEVSDATVGITSQIGMKYIKKDEKEVEKFEVFIEGGYRWLKFTNVSQEPKGGFTATPGGSLVQPGNLPESLDYSGFIIKGGIGIWF